MSGAKRIPTWVKILCLLGFCAVTFSLVTSGYPFVDSLNPLGFAMKIIVTAILTNLLGYAFYRTRTLGKSSKSTRR
jgi:hypothetical protein